MQGDTDRKGQGMLCSTCEGKCKVGKIGEVVVAISLPGSVDDICPDCHGSGVDKSKRTHTTDPSTSKEAELTMKASGKMAAQMRKVFAGVKEYPGHTGRELSGLLEMDLYAVRRRLSDLRHGRGSKQLVGIVGRRNGESRWWPACTMLEHYPPPEGSEVVESQQCWCGWMNQ